MEWEIELHDEVVSADRVEEAIDMLVREGPRLGRPLVDRVKAGHWKGWYDRNIPIAEHRFREHLRHGKED